MFKHAARTKCKWHMKCEASTSTTYINMNSPPNNAVAQKRRRWSVWVAAAAPLVALSVSTFFFSRHYGNILDLPSPVVISEGDNAIATDPVVAIDNATCTCEESKTNLLPSFAANIGLHGNVSDCCCSFADLEQANLDTVRPLLEKVVATPFFSHFRIDLCSDCPLWEDAPMCTMRDCSVCECDKPPRWAAAPADDCASNAYAEDMVVTDVDSRVSSSSGWELTINPPPSFLPAYISEDVSLSQHTSEIGNEVVVDLRLNPERYTGYTGESAEKVWTAIHLDNCFQAPKENEEVTGEKDENSYSYCLLPAEQRVYNRIISGMHSSISLHIAHSYCLEMDPERVGECRVWGHNTDLAKERVLDHKDRLENLYFAFSLLLRAVVKAGPAVTAAVPVQDDSLYADSISEWTESLLPEITRLEEACPKTFDEDAILMSGPGTETVRLELLRRFHHLQQIMRCVSCDRCKLWGTLQALGVGTALRVLFHDNSSGLVLSRQEAVALVHTLERFSSALVYAHDLSNTDISEEL